jgi:hypothetical protein
MCLIRSTFVVSLFLVGCVQHSTPHAVDATFASTPDATALPDVTHMRDSSSASDNHVIDPCDFRAPVDLRLRRKSYEWHPTTVILAETALELLSVTNRTRGSLAHLGVYTRVRVRTTGAEGYVYLDAHAVRRCQNHRSRTPDIRESRMVMVDGVMEEWRVRFISPSGAYPSIPPDEWNCIESFYNHFDRGDAVLERLRDGVVIERIDHLPCAEGSYMPCPYSLLIPRHAVPYPFDEASATAATLEHLPWITWLDIADYNHDGQATEFAVNVGRIACAVQVSLVVGVTRDRPRFHVLRWANGDTMSNAVDQTWWDDVRDRSRGEHVSIACGDHGYPGEQRIRWWPTPHGLAYRVIEREMPGDCGRIME